LNATGIEMRHCTGKLACWNTFATNWASLEVLALLTRICSCGAALIAAEACWLVVGAAELRM
jgi:hypothetical protein